MKVCFLYHKPFENLKFDSRVLKEARSLIRAGHHITILYGGKKKSYEKEVIAFDTKIPCISSWDSSPSQLGYLFWIFTETISEQLKRIRINMLQKGLQLVTSGTNLRSDVYHAHDFHTLLAGYILKKLTGARLIYDAHELTIDSRFVRNLNSFSKKLVRWLEIYLARRCDYVITVNDSIAEIMSKRMRIPKPVVIQNLTSFISENDIIEHDLRYKLGLRKNSRISIYLGGIKKGRGVEKIIRISKKFPDIDFVFMGSQHSENILNPTSQNVHILPPVLPGEVIGWTSSADFGISIIEKINLSHYLSLPNKVGEYIMAGIPIIVSDFPEMRKLAVDEDFGTVFNPENENDIVKAIKELLIPENYARKKQNVLKSRKKYCWENEEKKLLVIYEKLNNRIKGAR